MKPAAMADAWRLLVLLRCKGSFGRVAKAEGLSPSTVMRRMRSLEAALGIRILVPEGKFVRFTAAGAKLEERARKALAALSDPEPRTERFALEAVLDPALPLSFMMREAAAFLRRAKTSLSISRLASAHPQADISIRLGRIVSEEEVATPEVLVRTLAGSAGYFETHAFPYSVGELSSHALIAIAGDAAFSGLSRAGASLVTVPDLETALALARDGQGIALGVPVEVIAAEAQRGSLAAVPAVPEVRQELHRTYSERALELLV